MLPRIKFCEKQCQGVARHSNGEFLAVAWGARSRHWNGELGREKAIPLLI